MAKGKTIEKTAEKCSLTLEFIRKFVDEKGYPPTVREICSQVGFKSTASAKYYLDKLEEQGAIRKGDNKNRAIEIVEKNTKDKDNANVSQFKSDNIKNVNEVFANLISVPMLGNVAAGSPLYAEVENDTSYTIPADFFNCKGQMFLLNVNHIFAKKKNDFLELKVFEIYYYLTVVSKKQTFIWQARLFVI